MADPKHAVVMPLFGPRPGCLLPRLECYLKSDFLLVIVENNLTDYDIHCDDLAPLRQCNDLVLWVNNYNRGGVAGGFNRGVEAACATRVQWITLLDQDSQLSPEDCRYLRDPWLRRPGQLLVVGPRIWDQRRQHWQDKFPVFDAWGDIKTRLLISSGTTFLAVDWLRMGPMLEWLFVDFVDHAWSFHLQDKGFYLLQHPQVRLSQSFGDPHPNWLCSHMGMQLYSPLRHYYSLRNLRWLLLQSNVPFDLKAKELLKMLVKPWMWLLFEPRRAHNFQAILDALRVNIDPK